MMDTTAPACGAKRKRNGNHYNTAGDDDCTGCPTPPTREDKQSSCARCSSSSSLSSSRQSSLENSSCSSGSSVASCESASLSSCADNNSEQNSGDDEDEEEVDDEEFDELGEKFVEAAGDGDFETVQKMINNGTPKNIDYHNQDGSTALYRACEEAHLAIVQLLLKHGANTNEPSACEVYETAIMHAAKNGHYDMFMSLAEHGADLDVVSDTDWTPLLLAAGGESLGIVKHLVNNGCDITATVENPYEGAIDSVVNCAAKSSNHEILEFLVNEKGASIHAINGEDEPLTHAIGAKQYRNVAFLLEKGAKVNYCTEECGTPFDQAVWTRDRNLQLLLLHHGAEIDNDGAPGDTALVNVAERDPRYLDELDSDAPPEGEDPGMDDLAFLLEHGATINMVHHEEENANTALLAAAKSEHFPRVRLLLQAGCKLNAL